MRSCSPNSLFQQVRVLMGPGSSRPALCSFSLVLLLGMGLFPGQSMASNGSTPASETSHRAASSLQEGTRLAQSFSPNPGGMPGRREGGGTRGPRRVVGTPPTALIPETNQGTTLAANPTFYFYVPAETQGMEAELLLLDGGGETLYHGVAPLPEQEGIVSVPLPADLVLEPEQNYQWFFSVNVSEDDPSANVLLNGWVWRVAEDPVLTQQIEAIALSERPKAYIEAGLWYDALTALAELRRTNPGDADVQAQWNELLELVDLQAIAPKPVLDNLPVTVVPPQ